ncbi:MAG: polyprenyl diphosphate synthase [Nitrososphaerota archaeon]|nr:polyprenyl diphosphate synthase [Aigarchaeota archaeon]MDW8076906.1 polyprenyl diphosphate synthase [Nitrososphaerota archaeon]
MFQKLLKAFGVYWLYEKWLMRSIKNGPMPRHVALILDGNRRWARNKGLDHAFGHRVGADVAEKVLEWCIELKIKTVTLYVLSTENLKRNSEELSEIFKLIKERASRLVNDPRIHNNRVKITVIGRRQLIPDDVRRELETLEDVTKNYNDHFLNIAVAYGGRAEIVDATKKIALMVKEGSLSVDDIDEKTIESNLYTSGIPNSDPDLIIRTSGEERISNFLLWQSAYSELVFLDIFWPDFRKIDLLRTIRTYQRRNRRFGV